VRYNEKLIGRYYDVKFISGDKSIEITVNSIGKEMSLHEIRLELTMIITVSVSLK